MTTGLQFDAEISRQFEARARLPAAIARRRRILETLQPQPGECVLDIGCGPGVLASEIASVVGTSGQVCGIDVSESMLALARLRCAGQPWVEFRHGDAVKLPYSEGAFDAAVATQVFEYVHDMTAALVELHRILRPGGRALITDLDWDSIVWHSTDRTRMTRVLAAWDEHLADPCLPQTLSSKLRQAGFEIGKRDVLVIFEPDLDANGASHWVAELIHRFVPGRQAITQNEADEWLKDLQEIAEAGSYFFSINQYLFLAARR
jgi:arsenite methyltransferase